MSLLQDKEELIEDFEVEMIYKKISEMCVNVFGIYPTRDDIPSRDRIHIVEGGFIYKGNLNLSHEVLSLKISGLRFLRIEGDFSCHFCDNLTTLEGAPEVVTGDFKCSFCRNLTSLKGGPKEVGGNFECTFCDKLISLQGSPKKVCGDFRCSMSGIKTLDYLPDYIGGSMTVSGCQDLAYTPSAQIQNIRGEIKCDICPTLRVPSSKANKFRGDYVFITNIISDL